MGNAIAVDSAGNNYVAGRYSGTVDFDPTHTNPAAILTSTPADPDQSPEDAFVAKYDTAGNFVWVVSLGGGGDDDAKGVAVDAAGNVSVTGYFANTAAFGAFSEHRSAVGTRS